MAWTRVLRQRWVGGGRAALKLARQFSSGAASRQRRYMLARREIHGITLGELAMAGGTSASKSICAC